MALINVSSQSTFQVLSTFNTLILTVVVTVPVFELFNSLTKLSIIICSDSSSDNSSPLNALLRSCENEFVMAVEYAFQRLQWLYR